MSAQTQTTTSFEPVPQLDLAAQYAAIGHEIRAAVDKVLASQQFILGSEGAALETEIAQLCGAAHGIGVASGTDALILALRACGVRAGDEVIIPPFTFVATSSAVSAIGAKPVFADIRPDTYNIDSFGLARRTTSKTRAIIAVHLYGLSADMDPILNFARERNLRVIEDNAQSIGATYKRRRTGSLGDAACLSFYPTKNLGAYGDAGMIVYEFRTNWPSGSKLAQSRPICQIRQQRSWMEQPPRRNSGRHFRVKLRHLPEWQQARQSHAAAYSKLLLGIPELRRRSSPENYAHVFHQYTIRVERRDALQQVLASRNIGSSVYYPVPLHLQPLYASLGHKPGDFPHAEHAAKEVISLPMYPELRAEQITRVAETVAEFVTAEHLNGSPSLNRG